MHWRGRSGCSAVQSKGVCQKAGQGPTLAQTHLQSQSSGAVRMPRSHGRLQWPTRLVCCMPCSPAAGALADAHPPLSVRASSSAGQVQRASPSPTLVRAHPSSALTREALDAYDVKDLPWHRLVDALPGVRARVCVCVCVCVYLCVCIACVLHVYCMCVCKYHSVQQDKGSMQS